jgi:hypothetical protein
MRSVVVILADGLRPDVVTPGLMPSLDSLGRSYTRAANARTVRPSATVAALASLATGVGPDGHGLVEPGLGFLKRIGRLRPLARELADRRLETRVVAGALGVTAQPVAWALASAAGVSSLATEGWTARQVVTRAERELSHRQGGLTLVYLADCDRAGHSAGWMSPEYLAAAREIDAAIGALAGCVRHSLMIVLADHGGGGVDPRDHDQPHPVNDRIPLVLAGPNVRRQRVIRRRTSLLDVPATILWTLGVPVPECYEGRALRDAFSRTGPAAARVAA